MVHPSIKENNTPPYFSQERWSQTCQMAKKNSTERLCFIVESCSVHKTVLVGLYCDGWPSNTCRWFHNLCNENNSEADSRCFPSFFNNLPRYLSSQPVKKRQISDERQADLHLRDHQVSQNWHQLAEITSFNHLSN